MIRRRGVLLLVFLTCCQVLGFLLFCKGFLLKRVVIPKYSNCTHPHTTTAHPLSSCDNQVRIYKRVVWLLIDALRYDFMLWDESLSPPPIYRNKMPHVHNLLLDHPSNAKLFKFVADPPTSTMQRLKALTTGSLPTFIDIGSNFNSYEILEDSLIRQVSKNARNITFMGDDTWLGLYPSMLSKVFPYPSLNVKDIHTVDDGVLSQLFSELKKGDSDLLIGHFLGVDHIGHTYGPSHWTMGEKLPQMDRMVRDVVEAVDEETMVLVFGDHGMTSTGDHGGETELETHAALLVYSKQPLFHHQQPFERSVYQIDLVPTVALLLGLPIPFSNLGMLIPELLHPSHTEGYSHTDGYSGGVTHKLLTALRINAEQIHNYLNTYALYSEDFPQQVFKELGEKLVVVKSLHDACSLEASQDELTAVANGYVIYMREVKEMCHQVWAKFDDKFIFIGLFFVILAVLSAFVFLTNKYWLGTVVLCTVFCALVCVMISSSLEDALLNLVYCVCALNLIVLIRWMFNFFLVHFPPSLNKLRSLLDPLSVFALLLVVLHAFSLLSNSFVLYEGDMVLFFLQTLIFCLALKHLRLVAIEEKGGLLSTLFPYVALSGCLRLSKLFYSCRDLQYQDGCQDTTFTQPYTIAAESLGGWVNIRFFLSSATVVVTPILIYEAIFRNSLSKFVHVLYMVRYGLPVAGLCVVGHWSVQLLSSNQLSYWHHVTLPWVVYAVCGVTLVMAVWRSIRGAATSSVKSDTALVIVVVVTSLWVPLTMLLNDGLALASGAIALQAVLSVQVLSKAESPLVVAVFWALLTSHSFFACGHTTTVTSLRVEAAFTGIHGEINKFNLPLAGLLVGLNTLGPQLLFGLATPLLSVVPNSQRLQTHQSLKLALTLIAIHSLKLMVTMFAASLHRRHLMIWQVFTPRVLYEGAFQLTANISVLISMLVASRVKNLLQM